MKCPACENDMSHVNVGGVDVDVCKGGCGGIWFDKFEFRKFDEPREYAGSDLLEVEVNPDVKVDLNKKRNCPRCDNFTLMRHFFSVKKAVAIDECPGCAGIWLDAGELNTIRGLFASEKEKKEAASQIFDQMFGPKLAGLKEKMKDDSEQAKRMANMVRYVCPSNYIQGKQGWGAF